LVIDFDAQWEALVITIRVLLVEHKFGDHDCLVEVEKDPFITVGFSGPETLALSSDIVLVSSNKGGVRGVIVSSDQGIWMSVLGAPCVTLRFPR